MTTLMQARVDAPRTMSPAAPAIPNVAHFVWIGRTLPFIYGLALRSAVLRGGFEAVILHHTDELEEPPWFADVFGPRGAQRRLVQPRTLLGALEGPGRRGLVDGYERLTVKANQSDLLRAALLYRQGGVYLDTDVLVLAPLTHLLGHGMFFGSNRSVYDFREQRARGPRRLWLRAKSALRNVIAHTPVGLTLFKPFARLYPEHLTTAIWGSRPGHPAVAAVLDETARVLATPDRGDRDYNFVGPFLVQSILAAREDPDLACLGSSAFYPLPPVIASHWFRRRRNAPAVLASVLSPDTLVAHWYASGEVAPFVRDTSAESIRRNAPHQLYSALALAFLPAPGSGAPVRASG